MKNPFKKGDKVHHIFYGEGEVLDPDAQNHVKENGRTVLVKFLCGEIRQYAPKELSYKPWAKPNHDRPMDNVVYIVYVRDIGSIQIRSLNDGKWYFVDRELKLAAHVGVEFNYYQPIKKVN